MNTDFQHDVFLSHSAQDKTVVRPLAEQPLRAYGWSSWPEYLKAPGQHWPWLRVDRLLGQYRLAQDTRAGRRQSERLLEERRAGEPGADYRKLRRCWCLGTEAFRGQLLEQMQEQMGAEYYGAEREEAAEAKAERIVAEELRRRHWPEVQLQVRPKEDAVKVVVAPQLRAQMPVTVKWIARRLQTCAPGYINISCIGIGKQPGTKRQKRELPISKTDPF